MSLFKLVGRLAVLGCIVVTGVCAVIVPLHISHVKWLDTPSRHVSVGDTTYNLDRHDCRGGALYTVSDEHVYTILIGASGRPISCSDVWITPKEYKARR